MPLSIAAGIPKTAMFGIAGSASTASKAALTASLLHYTPDHFATTDGLGHVVSERHCCVCMEVPQPAPSTWMHRQSLYPSWVATLPGEWLAKEHAQALPTELASVRQLTMSVSQLASGCVASKMMIRSAMVKDTCPTRRHG